MDRQDIDALLVSALYGELTPADEARLAAHLESHPSDRTALDDLKVARNAVRESRIFELQLDPPQAVSALLLQEAARRAPKAVPRRDDAKAESWFQRFVRSFIAHPAMAAAATLVLVVGVASTLYLRNGEMKTASPSVETARHEGGEGANATPATADQGAVAFASDANATPLPPTDNEQVKVDLAVKADEEAKKLAQAGAIADDRSRKQQVAQHAAKPAGPSPNDAFGYDSSNADGKIGTGKDALAKTEPAKPTTPAKATGAKDSRRYVEVHTPEPTPKDMPDPATTETVAKGEAQIPANPRGLAQSGAGGGASNAAPPQAPRNTVAASPPPPPAGGPRPTASSAPPAPAAIPVEKPKQDPKPADKTVTKEDTNFAWAKDQHAQIIARVKANNCRDAAAIAVAIKNRAPDYYNAYVVPDRQIKQCMQYINDAAEKDAERSAKSRPAKRADLKEPAPAPAADTHK